MIAQFTTVLLQTFAMKGLIVNLFVLYFVLAKVSALNCFDCNSLHDPRCGDPFDNSSTLATVDCDLKSHPLDVELKSTFCRKITQTGEVH